MKNTDFEGRGLLYNNPLTMMVPQRVWPAMEQLIQETKSVYPDCCFDQKGIMYRAICPIESDFAACYWYIGQLYAHMISPLLKQNLR